MASFIWKKESLLNKIVYCFGWAGALNLFFWIVILIVGSHNYHGKFWNEKTHFVVYIFGWIYIPLLILGVLFYPNMFVWR